MHATLHQILGCEKITLITLAPAGVFTAISCKFLLVLGLGCSCHGLLIEERGVVNAIALTLKVEPQQLYCTLPTKTAAAVPQLYHYQKCRLVLRVWSTTSRKKRCDGLGSGSVCINKWYFDAVVLVLMPLQNNWRIVHYVMLHLGSNDELAFPLGKIGSHLVCCIIRLKCY